MLKRRHTYPMTPTPRVCAYDSDGATSGIDARVTKTINGATARSAAAERLG